LTRRTKRFFQRWERALVAKRTGSNPLLFPEVREKSI
jgi:hypothetical protein